MAKGFSWSFSKLKNYETCPKRHNEVDLLKTYVEPIEPGSPLDWGNRVHKALAVSCAEGTPMPAEMGEYQKWVDRVRAGPGKLLVEQKYAITRTFLKTSWFGHDAWYRGIGDVVRIDGPVALILDWKTGKVQPDSVQLMLMAQCMFSHFPQVRKVRSEYIWLADDCTTPETYDRADMPKHWAGLLPRVVTLEDAAKQQSYPPKPGRLCKNWCPVLSCPYHGKGIRS